MLIKRSLYRVVTIYKLAWLDLKYDLKYCIIAN